MVVVRRTGRRNAVLVAADKRIKVWFRRVVSMLCEILP